MKYVSKDLTAVGAIHHRVLFGLGYFALYDVRQKRNFLSFQLALRFYCLAIDGWQIDRFLSIHFGRTTEKLCTDIYLSLLSGLWDCEFATKLLI